MGVLHPNFKWFASASLLIEYEVWVFWVWIKTFVQQFISLRYQLFHVLISKKYYTLVFSPELNIYKLAETIDAVLYNLKTINRVFSEANLDYEDIFEKLGEAGIDLDVDLLAPVWGTSQGKCPKFHFWHRKFPFSDEIQKFVPGFLKVGNHDKNFRN